MPYKFKFRIESADSERSQYYLAKAIAERTDLNINAARVAAKGLPGMIVASFDSVEEAMDLKEHLENEGVVLKVEPFQESELTPIGEVEDSIQVASSLTDSSAQKKKYSSEIRIAPIPIITRLKMRLKEFMSALVNKLTKLTWKQISPILIVMIICVTLLIVVGPYKYVHLSQNERFLYLDGQSGLPLYYKINRLTGTIYIVYSSGKVIRTDKIHAKKN